MNRINESTGEDDAASGEDPLDEIVATCLESDAGELEQAVVRACESAPESAAEIRRRIEVLRKYGLVRPSRAADLQTFPDQLGGFRLLERLGGGGMGVVFRARQEALNREVALKLIRPEQLYFPLARERFRRETEAAARLQHPGIVPIHTVGEENGIPFFAMELVNGSTLADAVRELRAHNPEELDGSDLARALQHCAQPWTRWSESAAALAFAGSFVESVLGLVVQLADALHHAHERGVLHRDVKPSNVAVTDEGRAMLFDFGLASLNDAPIRLTQTRSELGSLAYMSPEQLRGARGEIDRRSDVYSLGVTLYELLALQLPFAESDPLETRRAILEGAPRPLRSHNRAVSRELEIVCAKAMERDAARRYADAAAFARDLRNVQAGRQIEARPASAALQVRRFVQRHPIATTILAAMFVLPSALWWQNSHHARELGIALANTELERKAAQVEAKDAGELNDFLIKLFSSVDPTHASGKEVTARDLLDEAAGRLETELVDQPLVRARLLTTIGESYASLAEWERGEKALQRALELNLAHAGSDSLGMVQTWRALAVLEGELGKPSALEHARLALDLHRKLGPGASLEFEDTLLCYARSLTLARQLDEAEAIYQETLAMIARMPGDQRAGRVGVLSNLASLQFERKQYEAALATAKETVELQRSVSSVPHPAVGSGLQLMSMALQKLQRLDEALTVGDEALAEEQRLTGEGGPRYSMMMFNKACLVQESGKLPEAARLFERTSELLAGCAPPTYEYALRCSERQGSLYQRLGRWSESLELYKTLGPNIDSVAGAAATRGLAIRVRRARADEALADWDAMEVELNSALEIMRDANAANDDLTESQAAALLARLRARNQDLEGARALIARSVELRGSADISSTAGAWTMLAEGIVAEAGGNLEEARAHLEPLASLETGPPNAESAPAIARAHLAAVLWRSDPVQAQALAARAHAELERELGAEHPESRSLVALQGSIR
ncbi:MAG TPA: serine/threonine-protein kinase [Planctomycetota bacterium]|nr:serine/threonine-protein kinase [Planctomycetota bacterium]